jgi:hypothetical protein
MSSIYGERAVEDALRYGNALFKVLSRNDVGATQSHQSGYLLPAKAWEMFTPFGPEPGRLDKHPVRVTWQDGRVTNSVITWYSSKKEYRLTGEMSGEFPWRTPDDLGSLLVLIRTETATFHAYVLDLDEDIEDVQEALGVELPAGEIWATFRAGMESTPSPDDCIARRLRQFVAALQEFPSGSEFSNQTLAALRACLPKFSMMTSDARLIRCIDSEYQLFRQAERLLCGPQIVRVFRDIDDFLKTANTILNRRKSRAGRALENHVEAILREARIPFDMRPDIEGEPDIVIPGKAQYYDTAFPRDKVFVVGVKTTCKDRWRQVVEEAPLVPRKYILTLQKAISPRQLRLMHGRQVTLVVPRPFHRDYPIDRPPSILLPVDGFLRQVRAALG